MKNNGLFNSVFIKELKNNIHLDDAAQGRMATLAQTWSSRNAKDTESLWESFLKQALSYLEFVPPSNPITPSVYPLYEDWDFKNCISVLYLTPPGVDIDKTSVGSFYPAKLLAQLKERNLSWGILTNSAYWRLYSTKSSRPYEDYVELPLAMTLENFDKEEYGLFERFFHKNTFIATEAVGLTNGQQEESTGIYKCRLDHDRDQSEKVLDEEIKIPFLTQVDEVLQYICNGFIFDTQKSGEEYTVEERDEIFESAVKLIYRCLFLFYAEARRLLPSDPDKTDLYRRHSIQALCEEARKFRWGERRDTNQYDLWKHLKGLINAVNDGDPEYGIMGYDGGLFDDNEEPFLGRHQLRNDFLSQALYLLAFVEPYDSGQKKEYAIPYEDLEVRHLGELYENILEFTVQLADADRLRRRTKKDVEILLASQTTKKVGDTIIKRGEVYFGESALERKQTGAYYTPEPLVRFLNEKTIVQPLRELFEHEFRQRFNELLEQASDGHDASTRRGAAQSAAMLVHSFVEKTVLNFKICDPAMGSGHFLVDAANQMAGLIVALLEEVPPVEGITISISSRPNDWRRHITRNCIYGVDLNPLAVNLSKLSLWLNCFANEHKLTFLDHHIRCGSSLIGIRSISQLTSIPNRKNNGAQAKSKQTLLFDNKDLSRFLAKAAQGMASIAEVNEDDTESQKTILGETLESISSLRPLADLHTAFLMTPGISEDNYKEIFEYLANGNSPKHTNPDLQKILDSVVAHRDWHHFYHWPLEFPDVFGPNTSGGFSVTVGNPPWDKLKPNSKEFFSSYDANFRTYKKPKANRVAKELMDNHPSIAKRWQEHKETLDKQNKYFKQPATYEYLGNGDIDTFKLFLERSYQLLAANSSMGLVIPGSLTANEGCAPLRKLLLLENSMQFLYSFENRRPTIFPAVDGRKKIIVMGMKKGSKTKSLNCAFMQHAPERLWRIDTNCLQLNLSEIERFSPSDFSIMEFRNSREIEIAESIYSNRPRLGDKDPEAWNVALRRELDMTNDSQLFKSEKTPFPLYEGKCVWHFDSEFAPPSRWISYEEASSYKKLKKSLWEIDCFRVGYRDIASATNERTLASSIMPKTFHGNKFPTVVPFREGQTYRGPNESEALFLSSVLSSFVMDFLIRRKVMETLNFFFIYSLPVPRVSNNSSLRELEICNQIIGRAARLICIDDRFADLWNKAYIPDWKNPEFWYKAPLAKYGPEHEHQIRLQLAKTSTQLKQDWQQSYSLKERLLDRRDTGTRAQFRAEIDSYVAHLYQLSRQDFEYILDTFPGLKKNEDRYFGEYQTKRKCMEEFDRIGILL
jgi:hypothetical protein